MANRECYLNVSYRLVVVVVDAALRYKFQAARVEANRERVQIR
jgi:hypothetical protein